MLILQPEYWKDYELIDCGDFEKLERFGTYITIRPEPQAVWSKNMKANEWERMAHVRFIAKSSSSGTWQKLKQMPDQWQIKYDIQSCSSGPELRLRLGLTSFKHVGVFPEQAVNWEYIAESVRSSGISRPKFLNLFAYTGAASVAARIAGAEVTHVDSIRQVVTWANQNMELSKQDNIRWIVEDALKFVKREIKRGNRYNGIILDPPAFGHCANGEKSKLEDNISEMISCVLELLDEKKHFLILNAYSLGFSSIIIENLLKEKAGNNLETGELYLQSKTDIKLPLGVFGRFRNF